MNPVKMKGKVMNKETEIDSVSRRILEKITPNPVERQEKWALARNLKLKVSAACKEFRMDAVVRIEGSFAKDTWLREDPDIDIFMRLPRATPRIVLDKTALYAAKKATEGSKQVERFAEHPYLEAIVDGVRVNIVPCYDSKPGEWLSATDRTPYHTNYINTHLDEVLRGDVRLLKKFMKSVNVYGAEIKVGGFSGYLCELLVLHYGSFKKVLESFADHTPKRIIDIEGFYEQRHNELSLLFSGPLVVVDPVDKARNVASAVQPKQLYTFVAASRIFLKDPNAKFFDHLKVTPLSLEKFQEALKSRGSTLIFLILDKIEAVPDVLWGQLHRTRKALRKQLELSDFKVLRDDIWSNENATISVFVFELEQQILPNAKKHLGPPLEFQKECESFLSKYMENSNVLAGPFIDSGRWVVEMPRKFTDAAELLRVKIASGGKDVGVAGLIAMVARKHFLVLVGDQVTGHYIHQKDFAEFLTSFLSGKPFWLKTSQKTN